MAPHVQPLSQENADDSLMDDFDSVFGERSATNGYGSFLLATPTATHDESGTLINMKVILVIISLLHLDSLQMSTTEAKRLIDVFPWISAVRTHARVGYSCP